MSDTTFAVLVTIATFAFFVMWNPFLDALAASPRRAKVTAQIFSDQALISFESDRAVSSLETETLAG